GVRSGVPTRTPGPSVLDRPVPATLAGDPVPAHRTRALVTFEHRVHRVAVRAGAAALGPQRRTTTHRHPRARAARALRPAEPPSGSWLQRWAAPSDTAPPGPPQPRASPRRSGCLPGRRAWRLRLAAAWRTPAAPTGQSRS